MVRVLVPGVVVMLGLAACATTAEQPKPPVWSARYVVPFEVMANCLSTRPAASFAVSAPLYGPDGVATITFVPGNTPQAGSAYVVRRLPGGASQVDWRRPGQVGGLDWLDVEARTRADGCGGA